MQRFLTATTYELLVFNEDRLLMASVVDIGEFKEDQTEHRRTVFRGLEVDWRASYRRRLRDRLRVV